MQNYCKTIGALAAASALVAGNAKAEVEYELHTGYSTEYIFRGIETGDNMVEVGLDAAGKWNNVGLSAGVWAAAFDSNRTGTLEHEVDLYTEANYNFGFMTGAIGYIYYWNVTNQGPDSQEVYFSLSRDLGFATASLTYYWGIAGANNDGYTELGLSRSWELSPCLKLNVSSKLGYLVEQGQCTAWTNKASLDWGFREHAKLSPFVTASMSLSDDNDTAYFHAENEYSIGTMLSVSF